MNSQLSNLLFIVGVVAVFYLVVLRPQQQRVKKQKEMSGALQPGDEIVTFAGVFAVVVSLGERLRVRLVDGAEMEIAPAAVSRVVTRADVGQTPIVSDSSDSEAVDAFGVTTADGEEGE